jgi:protein-tyrosine-phosphatase
MPIRPNPVSKRTVTIHFICTGNMYRSRLAEAYCVSRGAPGLNVVSSGTGTHLNSVLSIAPHAAFSTNAASNTLLPGHCSGPRRPSFGRAT